MTTEVPPLPQRSGTRPALSELCVSEQAQCSSLSKPQRDPLVGTGKPILLWKGKVLEPMK